MDSILDELETIRKRNGGMLKPESVVAFARDSKTALHNRFEWDDSAAAEQYRLQQAHRIIRVTVTVLPNNPQPVRAYVSLIADRNKSRGYSGIQDVLEDDGKRAAMLEEAKIEMRGFKKRYESLTELAGIFAAIDEVVGNKTTVAA